MTSLSKLGAWLIAMFALCLVILAADIAYVIWRRRSFHRRSSAAVDSVIGSSGDSQSLSSKELLYFLCWKNQSNKIEPNDHHNDNHNQVSSFNGSDLSSSSTNSESTAEESEENDDVLKLYGRSRLLFTIKEEEENIPVDQKSDGQDRPVEDNEFNDVESVPRVSFDDATPFSTPCASPPYYTPSPSPSRDDLLKWSQESYGEGPEFVSLDIIGV